MYRNFFGFSEKPFELTPDPRFLFLSRSHVEALASLTYGIQERRGLIVIVGEVGTGKTLLLNAALDRFSRDTKVAYFFNTGITPSQIVHMALVELGLARPEEDLTKVEALDRLNNFAINELRSGGNVALLVDEAQNLDRSSMESLRLLSNLETHKHKLIQIVLSGQPELDTRLKQPELRQIAQRISLKRHILPLKESETYQYLRHRLRVADYSGPELFDRRAKELIWEYSGGVPRKINILCDNALLIAYGLRTRRIKAPVVQEAVDDLSWSPSMPSAEARILPAVGAAGQTTPRFRFSVGRGLALATCIVLLAAILLGRSHLGPKGGNPVAVSTTQEATAEIQQQAFHRIPITLKPDLSEATIIQSAARSEAPEGNLGLSPAASSAEPGDGLTADEGKEKMAKKEQPLRGTVTKASPGESRTVAVRKGDSLFRIITRAYGRCDTAALKAVLQENPWIENPAHIEVGQEIRLPVVTESN
jgi:general secretion pathway protein A